MSKSRINISMDPAIRALADSIMEARCFGDFSGFLEQLIREEFDRRIGPTPLGRAPSQLNELVAGHAQRRGPRSAPRVDAAGGPEPVAAPESVARQSAPSRHRKSHGA
jgi:hypothetical protein